MSWIELAILGGTTAFNGALIIMGKRLQKEKSSNCPYGSIPWSIYHSGYAYGVNYGFQCPKCINRDKNKEQYPICECEDFPREHFHFKCGDCGFKAILRTADDK